MKNTRKSQALLSDKKELNKLCLKIRSCKKYKAWRQAVLLRDNEKLKNLQVHHKDPFRDIISRNNIKSIEDAEKCRELWNISNGITITKGEHRILSLIERYKYHTDGFFTAMYQLLEEQEEERKQCKLSKPKGL